MTRSVFSFFAILTVLLTFENCRTTGSVIAGVDMNLQDNILVRYGEYLYEREDCASCHTLEVAETSEQLVSLDGLGGKYSNEWYYIYFADPSALIFDSQKDDYSHLYEGSLDRFVVERLAKQGPAKYNKEDLDQLWVATLNQAYEVATKAVYRAPGEDARTDQEVLALIAYLQQIPLSEQQEELDRVQSEQLFDGEAAWAEIELDSNSIVFQIAEAPGNLQEAQSLFKGRCGICHGQQGEGGIGPNLTDDYWLHGGKTLDIIRTVVYGIPEKGMISWKSQMSPEQVGMVVGYVKSLRGTNPQPAKAPQGELERG